MTKEDKLQMAVALINDYIKKTNERWVTDRDIRTYAWGWRDNGTLSSLHDNQFYYMDEIVNICRALGLHYTLTVGDNLDGVATPFVRIF